MLRQRTRHCWISGAGALRAWVLVTSGFTQQEHSRATCPADCCDRTRWLAYVSPMSSPPVDRPRWLRGTLPLDAYCSHPGVTTASKRERRPDRRRVRDRIRGIGAYAAGRPPHERSRPARSRQRDGAAGSLRACRASSLNGAQRPLVGCTTGRRYNGRRSRIRSSAPPGPSSSIARVPFTAGTRRLNGAIRRGRRGSS
jgi:hypothetical protein